MTDFNLGDRICEQPQPHQEACSILQRALIWHGLDERPREVESNDMEND